jgi:hypothetical protein
MVWWHYQGIAGLAVRVPSGRPKPLVADQTWCIVAVCLSCAIAGVVLRSAVMGELVGGVQFLDHGGKFSEFSSLSSVLGRILLSTTLYL